MHQVHRRAVEHNKVHAPPDGTLDFATEIKPQAFQFSLLNVSHEHGDIDSACCAIVLARHAAE